MMEDAPRGGGKGKEIPEEDLPVWGEAGAIWVKKEKPVSEIEEAKEYVPTPEEFEKAKKDALEMVQQAQTLKGSRPIDEEKS